MPNDDFPDIPGEPKIRSGFFRECVFRNGGMDLPTRGHTSEGGKHSELFLNQTYREYFLTIDELISQTGVRDQLDRLHGLWSSSHLRYDIAKYYLEEITMPVIERMLGVGYTYWDLAC